MLIVSLVFIEGVLQYRRDHNGNYDINYMRVKIIENYYEFCQVYENFWFQFQCSLIWFENMTQNYKESIELQIFWTS